MVDIWVRDFVKRLRDSEEKKLSKRGNEVERDF